jgi:hypothetical protein
VKPVRPRSRFSAAAIALCLASAAFAQSVLTGTVADPGGRAVARARILLRNVSTGAQYERTSSARGEYRIASLPAGAYELSVMAAGFRRFLLQGITIPAGGDIRLDVFLEAGFQPETAGSAYEAPLLRSEATDPGTVAPAELLNALPLVRLQVRNPLDFATFMPGVTGSAGQAGASPLRVNGSPATTYRVTLDGQDITSSIDPSYTLEQQPSVEALAEFTLQGGNAAAEFGQSAGGLFNLSTRSGGSQWHGSLSAYVRNEQLDAGRPFSDDGSGHHLRPPRRDADLAGNLGGPVILPRIYNGRERTFFFVNVEQYRARGEESGSYTTVPTEAYRRGDFSAALTGRSLGKDSLGRDMLENMIYDPLTSRTVSGQVLRDPFAGNRIDPARFDPVAVRLQSLIPAANPGLVHNFEVRYRRREDRGIPSIKIDHGIMEDARVSFYYSAHIYRGLAGQDGLPAPLTGSRDRRLLAQTARLSGDYTVTPTLLARAVFGYVRWSNRDAAVESVLYYPAADPVSGIGLRGGLGLGMPRVTIGLGAANRGGMAGVIGTGDHKRQYADKPSAAGSLTHIRGHHTYKAGGEARQDIWTPRDELGPAGSWTFRAAETALPYLETSTAGGGSIGFPYASFLLGRAGSARVSTVNDPRFVRTALGVYLQDSWKAGRKVTLNYGFRWDSQSAPQETRFRTSMFAPTIANPSAGGLAGAMVYEGFGPGRCNCSLTNAYPYAVGPRLGAAYQADSRTVLRAGWGVSYGQPNYYGGLQGGIGFGWNTLDFTTTSFGEPAATLRAGMNYDPAGLYAVTLDPGLRPQPGQINSPPYYLDPNGGRPSRIHQWNVSLQRELTPEMLVEAAYVGNRGVWIQANSLLDFNGLTPQRIASFGLDVRNAADQALLTSPLNSPLAQSRGFHRLPYAGYPATLTVAQSLRPFPQFQDIPVRWAPLGNTWYDSLQVKLIRRFRRGVSWSAAFTWQKELTLGAADYSGSFSAVNDAYNRAKQKTLAPQSTPFRLVTTFSYESPGIGPHALVRKLADGWTVSGLLRYQSGPLILIPASQNNLALLLFRGTYANRVAGRPLFLTDINGKFDPNQEFVLNPEAWSDAPAGEWGQSAVYYNDYRGRRVPEEQLSLGRVLRFSERTSLELRVEFYNAFNRLRLPAPDSANALSPQARDSRGRPVSGFGYIDTAGGADGARNGQFVVRLRF